ncbi:hypothetical protein N9C96_00605 [bacterium]|nr:hypothetical protein [bacterium]
MDFDRIINYGTLSLDNFHFDLKLLSSNGGIFDHGASIAVWSQTGIYTADGACQLSRIGDTALVRYTQAAIYDVLQSIRDI